jgi:hypothetical protein
MQTTILFEYFTLCGERIYICNIIQDRLTKEYSLRCLCSTILLASKQKFVFVIELKILWKMNSFNQNLFIYVNDLCTKIWIFITHELYNWWIIKIKKIKITFSYLSQLRENSAIQDIMKSDITNKQFWASLCITIWLPTITITTICDMNESDVTNKYN